MRYAAGENENSSIIELCQQESFMNEYRKKQLMRLIEALIHVWPNKRGRNAEICKRTGYSPGHVSGVMNGKVALDDKFIKSVCREFSINEDWVVNNEGHNMLVSDQGKKQEIEGKTEDYPTEDKAILEMLKANPLLKLALMQMKDLSEEKQFEYWKKAKEDNLKALKEGGQKAAGDTNADWQSKQ